MFVGGRYYCDGVPEARSDWETVDLDFCRVHTGHSVHADIMHSTRWDEDGVGGGAEPSLMSVYKVGHDRGEGYRQPA